RQPGALGRPLRPGLPGAARLSLSSAARRGLARRRPGSLGLAWPALSGAGRRCSRLSAANEAPQHALADGLPARRGLSRTGPPLSGLRPAGAGLRPGVSILAMRRVKLGVHLPSLGL